MNKNFEDSTKFSNPLKNNRIGMFQIGLPVLNANYKEILELLADVFITRCEFIYGSGIFQCAGASKHFDVVKEGAPMEIYDILCDKETNKFYFKNFKERMKTNGRN